MGMVTANPRREIHRIIGAGPKEIDTGDFVCSGYPNRWIEKGLLAITGP